MFERYNEPLAGGTKMDMTTLDAVEKLALELPESQRTVLARRLLHSLPALFLEEDEGLAEARRRDEELNHDPTLTLSLKELDQKIRSRQFL